MFDHLQNLLRDRSDDPLIAAALHAIEDLTAAPLDFIPDERKVELDEEIAAAPSNERLLRDLRDDIRAMERAIRTLNVAQKRAQEEVAAAEADAERLAGAIENIYAGDQDVAARFNEALATHRVRKGWVA